MPNIISSQSIHNPELLVVFLVVSVVMGSLHRRMSSSGSFLMILGNLPFTAMHELSHFLVAAITGGHPSSFSLWPKRDGNGWILGSVSSIPTLLSAAPTALAPLGWLAFGYYSIAFWDMRPIWMPELMIWPILYACAAASTPSGQDIKIAITHPFSLLLWAAIIYIASQF